MVLLEVTHHQKITETCSSSAFYIQTQIFHTKPFFDAIIEFCGQQPQQTKQVVPVFGSSLVLISARIPVIQTDILWSPSVIPGKWYLHQATTTCSKSFPIHQTSYHQTLYSLDTDCVDKHHPLHPTKKHRNPKMVSKKLTALTHIKINILDVCAPTEVLLFSATLYQTIPSIHYDHGIVHYS